jgi:pyruvate,water dikinase
LSHPAIASREYGIPCVLSVQEATRHIRDGQMITVDGEHGTVELL